MGKKVCWMGRSLLHLIQKKVQIQFLQMKYKSPESRGSMWAYREGLIVLFTEPTYTSGCLDESLPYKTISQSPKLGHEHYLFLCEVDSHF
jgi:hypothetical protein